MEDVFQCIHCRGCGLKQGEQSLNCGACGTSYPIRHGVPLLIKDVSCKPSGFFLSAAVAEKACKLIWISPSPANVKRLQDIFATNYELADLALHAENNYFLHRIDVAEDPGAQPLPCAGVPVNQAIRYRFIHHYIPERLPAGKKLLNNIRLSNRGSSIISSKTANPVCISYHWLDAGGRLVHQEGLRTSLPVDIVPGREITVPVMLETPTQPGSFFLQLTLVHETVEWLDRDAMILGVEVANDVPNDLPAGWIKTGRLHANYDDDHRAGQGMLLQALQGLGNSDLKILELGGCCSSGVESLHLPCEIYNVDIDVQTLQAGCLREPSGPSKVHYVCADANDLPFAPRTFDCAVMFATLHHFANPSAVLRKLKSLVKPGGFVATLYEPVGHYHNGHDVDPRLLRELEQGINEQTFVPSEYERIFAQAGLAAGRVVLDEGSLKAILRPGPETLPEQRPVLPVWRHVAWWLKRQWRRAA